MDILYFRVLLTLGSLGYLLWGFFIINVALDNVIWGIINVSVNIALCVPLIRQRMMIRFNINFERIYENFFKGYLSRFQFRIVKRAYTFTLRKKNQVGTEIIRSGNPFDSVILFTRIPYSAHVGLYHKGTKVTSIKEGTWYGVPELLENERLKEEEKIELSGVKSKRIIIPYMNTLRLD
jgi:hypothetical protein